MVVEELAQRLGLVVEERLLLCRQLGRVRVELVRVRVRVRARARVRVRANPNPNPNPDTNTNQVLEARRAREDVAVEACGAAERTSRPRLACVAWGGGAGKLPGASSTFSTARRRLVRVAGRTVHTEAPGAYVSA